MKWPFGGKSEIAKLRRERNDALLNLALKSNSFGSFLKHGGQSKVTDSIAYELYDKTEILASSVDIIAGAVAALKPVIMDGGAPGSDPRVEEVIKSPGFNQTWHQLVLDYTVAYLLTGNGYLITDPNGVTIRHAKPTSVTVREDQRDGFAGQYTVSQASSQLTFSREDVGTNWEFVDPFGQKIHHLKPRDGEI